MAHDAVQAVDKAIREKPDLILLDIKMPAGSGISGMDHLRNSSEIVLIPIIVITAYPSPELQQQVKEMGARGLISKPLRLKTCCQESGRSWERQVEDHQPVTLFASKSQCRQRPLFSYQ
jgi:CheY-like chemotaxis protein